MNEVQKSKIQQCMNVSVLFCKASHLQHQNPEGSLNGENYVIKSTLQLRLKTVSIYVPVTQSPLCLVNDCLHTLEAVMWLNHTLLGMVFSLHIPWWFPYPSPTMPYLSFLCIPERKCKGMGNWVKAKARKGQIWQSCFLPISPFSSL